MADAYVLSEDDAQKLKTLWATHVQFQRLRAGRPDELLDDAPAAEFYVAKTPEGGIGGIIDSVNNLDYPYPGFAECQIYELTPSTNEFDVIPSAQTFLIPVDQLTHRVYNATDSAIDGDQWIKVAKDKYGYWHVVTGGDETFLALLVQVEIYQNAFYRYSYLKLGFYNPDTRRYSVTGRGGPLFGEGTRPLFHARNLLLPVAPSYTLPGTGTGTTLDEVTGTGTGSLELVVDEDNTAFVMCPQSVVRVYRGKSEAGEQGAGALFYLFHDHPWEDLFRLSGDGDEDGYQGFHRLFNQQTGLWEDGIEVRLVIAD